MLHAKKLQITQCILAAIVALFMTTTAFAQSGFNIVEQVAPITVVPKGLWGTLIFSVNYGGNEVSYQWYRTYSDPSRVDEKIEGANSSAYGTNAMNEGDVRFFYCIATYKGNVLKSNVGAVVSTGLPQLYVSTPGNVEIVSKDVWIDNASISLSYTEKKEWEFTSKKTSIRARGNSTLHQPKKPFALKLDKAMSIMGMSQHKRWVLIANYLDNSFLKNHIAFYMSKKLGMDYTVQGRYVDLFLNGEYKGLYWLGEAIKVDVNRVNIYDGYKGMSDKEDKDFLVEMDKNYDENPIFETSRREMPYKIKNDDYMVDGNGALTAGGNARLTRFQKKIENLEKLLYPNYVSGMNTNNAAPPDERYSNIIDVDSWAKFWLINDLMDNIELQHPKSCYFTYQNDIDLFKAGPVWDFDWSSLTTRTTYLRESIYYDALFKSPLFILAVKRIWDTYSKDLKISAEIEKMREYLRAASVADSVVWVYHPHGEEKASYDEYVDFLKDLLNKKFKHVGKFITDTLPKVKAISPKLVMLSDKLEYGGTAQKPVVTVLDENYALLKEGVDYTLSYANNINIGTASLHFAGKGNYAGMLDTTFSIVPKSVVVTVDTLSKSYGEKDPEWSYSVKGLLSFGGVKERLNGVELTREPGENAGEYAISATVNPAANPSYYSVTVKKGVLSINPDTTKIVVSVKGSTDTVEYNGKKHSVQGFEMASSNDAYSLDFVNYKGDSLVSGTDADTYAMGLVAKNFKNTSGNYSNVVFDITDGNLVITPKPAVLTVADASKTYGKKDPKLKYSVKGLVKDSLEGVTLVREAGEDAGEYAINAKIDSAANSNYALSVEKGLFTINPDTTKIVVTVKGHKDTVVYDGKKHSVRGFDMKSSLKAYSVDFVNYKGDSLASGTKVKTYAMGLVAKDFKNTSVNYTNVVFKVEDGSLTIKKKEVEKKDALLASRVSVGLLKVYAMDRRIQVNTSMTGERFAVYDMQGVVVQNGLVNAASFEIQVPKAGAYMVRVGSQVQRVDVR